MGFVRRTVQHISTTTEFLHVMVFKRQFGVSTRFQIRTETDRLILQFRKFRKSVSVIIISRPMTVLPEDIQSGTMIVRYKGSIQRGVVIECGTATNGSDRMR